MQQKMRALSNLSIGLILVSGLLFLALIAELYYLFLWKKRTTNRELLRLFSWRKPISLSSTTLNPQELDISDASEAKDEDSLIPFEEEAIEAELMRLHSLAGPPRFLFTIKEETKEELESLSLESSLFMTPLSSPSLFTPNSTTPLDCYYAELDKAKCFTPPPKFKFLRDAEEKLYRKTLKEEALRLHKFAECASPSKVSVLQEDAFLTIVIGKSRERSSSSSQVNPLPSPPTREKAHRMKLGSYLRSMD